MSKDDFVSDFIKARQEINEKRRAKEEKLGMTAGQIKAIKDYANSILTNAINIEFAQLAVEDGIVDYEDCRKIIDWQKKQINESMKYLEAYVNPEIKER